MSTATDQIKELTNTDYKYGFVTDVEQDIAPKGLNEDIVRLISSKKGEPEWLLEWRLKAFRAWLKMAEPHWQNVKYEPIDYQGTSYYAAPKEKKKLNSLRGRSGNSRDLQQARHPARGAEAALERRR